MKWTFIIVWLFKLSYKAKFNDRFSLWHLPHMHQGQRVFSEMCNKGEK